MGRLREHLEAAAVVLATLTLSLGGVVHAAGPSGEGGFSSGALCLAVAQSGCEEAGEDAPPCPTAPDAPSPHEHQPQHDHRCILCQLLRAHAVLASAPPVLASGLTAEPALPGNPERRPAPPERRPHAPRAPPLG